MPYRLGWTCLWPGLSRLWLLGEGASLLVAVAFAIVLNALIAATMLWPRSLGADGAVLWLPLLAWTLVLCFWGGSVWHAARQLHAVVESTRMTADTALFCEAQLEYLKGEFTTCERRLRQLLSGAPRDVDARMMLVAVLRRTERADEALNELTAVERLDGSRRWWWEIEKERTRANEALATTA